MKKLITVILPFCAILVASHACKQEEGTAPALGKATFSFLPAETNSDGTVKEVTVTAVLLSITDGHGQSQENIKLPLHQSGQGYRSESLELKTGNYQLTRFSVLDDNDDMVYTTPQESSRLAQFVTDPLPMEFVITAAGDTQVVPQTLEVTEDDDTTDIFIDLRYPEQVDFDSALMILKDSALEIRYKLTLNNQTHLATGYIPGVPVGDRKVSIAYYNEHVNSYQHSEKTGVSNIRITPTTTDIISDNIVSLQVKDQNGLVTKPIAWTDYYYLHLENNFHKRVGFARIPQDPMNPFIEVAMANPAWSYISATREFYHLDYFGHPELQWVHIESGATEIYGAHLLDTTSFVRRNTRYVNFVGMYILAFASDAHNDEEASLIYTWNLGVPESAGTSISHRKKTALRDNP